VTHLKTWEGWLYLAAVQDAYSRAIVGWSMAEHMRSELVVDALQMAVTRRRPEPGLIHHSDQGSQYVSLAFGQAARDAGIARSMGSKGRRLRQRRRRELLRHPQERARAPPLLADPPRAGVHQAFYNRVRRHSTLGMLAPLEFENSALTPHRPSLAASQLGVSQNQIINS
jgi:putative transposase